MMYAILPGVATLGAAGLLAILAAHSSVRRRHAGHVPAGAGFAMVAGGMTWAASEPTRPRLVVTKFDAEPAGRPAMGADDNVAVRLDRLRQALDQLTGLLLIGTAGEDGQADFLAALAFLTGACQRRNSTIHLEEVEETALAIEGLCFSLARTERMQRLLGA